MPSALPNISLHPSIHLSDNPSSVAGYFFIRFKDSFEGRAQHSDPGQNFLFVTLKEQRLPGRVTQGITPGGRVHSKLEP